MGKKHSPEFVKKMTQFYRANKDASIEKAKKHASRFGYDSFSKGSHDRYRKMAAGHTQPTTRRRAPAGKQKVPKRVWLDQNSGEFFTDFDAGRPGTQVAIYELVARGSINLAYPQAS
jgi:hypothetical protein